MAASAPRNPYLQDQVEFTVAGATASTVTDVSVTFTIDGAIAAATGSGLSLRAIDGFGDASIDVALGTDYASPPNFGVGHFWENGWVSYTVDDADPTDITFTDVYQLVGATPSVGVTLDLGGSAGGGYWDGASADYLNTNAIRLGLPSGVTYTSDSGVFLSNPAAPEPSTWAMLLLGFAGVGFAGLRASRKSGTASA